MVAFHFTLTSDEGEVLDASAGGPPLVYLHGVGAIVPGLERGLEGRAVGERFDVRVLPADGYGKRKALPFALHRSHFPPDLDLASGMQLTADDDDGVRVPIWVLAVRGDTVVVDKHHPLAGSTLNYAVEVLAVRDPTAEELAFGRSQAKEEGA